MIWVIVLATVLSVGAFVFTFSVVFGRRQAVVERRLTGYELVPAEEMAKAPGSPDTAMMQQAVAFTGRLAEKTGLLTHVERALEQGDLPIRAGELIFYVAALGVAGFLIFTLLFGPFMGLIVAIIAGMAPVAYVSQKQRGRTQAFERQLPDTLTLLASSLRAGFSFMQGLETVAQEIGTPMRRELARVFTEVRLGRPVEDALGDAAARMNSRDLAWTVMAIKIQREVGGNLATLLDTVADTMLKRDRIRREIKALTAEGRMSAIVLALVPVVTAFGLYIIAPDYLSNLTDYTAGYVAIIGSIILMIAGGFWLRRLVDIEV